MPQLLDLSKRRWATKAEVLGAFRDRLIEACPGCNSQTCFISDQPTPLFIPAGGGHCVTVAAGKGSFDQRLFSGGGHSTLNEDFSVIITPMIRIDLDRIPQAERALLASDRGLVKVWQREILRTLLMADPDLGEASQAWEPSVGDRPLCRDQIRPLNVTEPADVPNQPGWIGMHLTFSASFDWDLYSE